MIEVVKAALANYEWKFDIESEDHIITGFKSDLVNRVFTIHIFWSEDWIVLLASILSEPVPTNLDIKLSIYIARANFFTPIVKYSITPENEVVLSVELPMRNLSSDCLITSLEMLCASVEEQSEAIMQVLQSE